MCDWEKIKNLKNKNLRSENAKICSADIKNLEAETLKTQNLQTQNLQTQNLNVCSINGKAVCAAEYQNIVPTFQIVDYSLNGEIVDPFTPGATPVQPPNTEGINPQVWDTLWQNAVENLENPEFGLKARLQCGRLTEKYIQNSKNCTVCPPNNLSFCAPRCATFVGQSLPDQPFVIEITEVNTPPDRGTILEIGSILSGDGVTPNTIIVSQISGTPGGVGTYLVDQENYLPSGTVIHLVGGPTPCSCPNSNSLDCPSVPMRILALDTYTITTTTPCESCKLQNNNSQNNNIQNNLPNTQTSILQYLSSVSYNLEVRNLNDFLATRVVSVMVQLAYLDEAGTPQLRLIDFSNKQFPFTLDSLYGEKFAANILISSELVKSIAAVMPQIYGNYAAAQIVVYMEEGVEVQFVAPARRFARVAEDSKGSANAQYLGQAQITQNIILSPGIYPVTPGSKIVMKGGGGGGGGSFPSSYTFMPPPPLPQNPQLVTSTAGGGGGGEGNQLITFVPENVYYFTIVSVGQGGKEAQDGGETVGYFSDSNGNQISTSFTVSGGKGGQNGMMSNPYTSGQSGIGGNGGNGLSGGGGGAGSGYEGQGGHGPLGNGDNANGVSGGKGGNNGGIGGSGELAPFTFIGGGGGGAGAPIGLDGSVGTGAAGGSASNSNITGNGFSWTGNLQPNILYGIGGGGGAGNGRGGDGAPGYVLFVSN